MRAGNFWAKKLLLTVALVAVAAACSSSSKSADNVTTPSSAGAVTTLPATTTPVTKSYTGSSDSSFCHLMRKDEADFRNNKNLSVKTPAQLKALYAKFVPALEHAAAVAPSEIKADLETYVTEVKKIDATFAAAQYNLENVNPTVLAGLNTPQLEAAFANVNQYFSQVCHITTPTT
jgi:hypothetical protein